MKLKKKRRTISGNQCPSLIGYAGKATLDSRLFPLRMDRKYRTTLEQAEQERDAKIFQMKKFDQQSKNLTNLMKSLEQENFGKCNTDLLKELNEMKMELERKLHRLEAELQDCPLKNVKGPMTMNKIVGDDVKMNQLPNKSDSTNCEKHKQETEKRKSYIPPINVEALTFSSSLGKSGSKKPRKRNRWSASFKSQIFVKKTKSQIQPISIDLFSSGHELFQVLAEEFGEDIDAYNVMFGTKKVDKEKTLFEQEIYHGTTVDLNLRLQGGMHKRKKQAKKPKKKKENPKTPEMQTTESSEMWTKQQVGNWVSDQCKEFEIDENEVSKLKSQNGKGLDRLSKEDWIRRSENHGDLFFNLWQELKQNTAEVKDKEEVVHMDEQIDLSRDREENSANEDSNMIESSPFVPDSQNDFRTGMIGKVSTLEDIEELIPLESFGNDGSSSIPDFGSVITVRGVLEKKPRTFENLAALLIRDEPQGAASSYTVMNIDIRSNEENKKVCPQIVKMLLEEIRTGFQIGIKGRVEILGKNDFVKGNAKCEFLKFKLVIDSDQHSLVYVESKREPFKRQLSQPQWFEQLHSTSLARCFKIGDRIEMTADTILFNSTVTDEEIIKYIVAFKNSFNGNVLIGVEENGVITGLDMNESEVANWRENLSKAIGSIVPPSSEGAAICNTKEEALDLYEKKCFVLVMALLESKRQIAWIHVPKGEERLYVTKSSDIHAFVRTGAETKRLTDFAELFSRLDSLGSRNILPISDEDIDVEQIYNDITGKTAGLQKKYQILKKLDYENQEQEFKMIFGDDPVKTILEKYLCQYSCGFLNSTGGSIIFGVQEDEKSKVGHIVGIAIPTEQRKALVKTAVKALSNFYPPVNTSQYSIVFHDVVVPNEFLAKCNDNDSNDKCILIRGPADEVGYKWPKFAKDKFPDCLCRVVRVRPQLFCVVLERLDGAGSYDIGEIIKEFIQQNKKKKISFEYMHETELKYLLKEELCIIELTVKRSQYPIHMVKPIDTYVVDIDGNCLPFEHEMMMHRFELGFNSTGTQFDVKKFLNHVDNFRHSGNSYILIASPFKLSATENDIYGLVIPKWALAIDFDQHLKQKGHLFQLFDEFNDLHQMERNRFIKTPKNSELGLNAERGICWLAARGYDEIEESLSPKEHEHGTWNMTHRDQLRSLLKTDLAASIKPNYLNIIVLWDEGHEKIVDSLRVILEDILSINGERAVVTIVCCTTKARRYITENLVKQLQKSYGKIIIEERVHVAPPYVLARHLSSKLPDPYKPENEFQVPHKREYRGKPQTFPRILPKHIRQNIKGFLEMMYICQARKPEKTIAEERQKFYSGSAITFSGLRENFGIQRAKMVELETYFKILLNDRKSDVSMICIKVERGAGSTTMCLQFLFKHHEEYPCAQLIDIGDGLLSYIKDIYRETKLPLILFVDEEIAHLQDFFDFTKELVEYRHVNVILLFIEPKEAHSKKESSSHRKAVNSTRMKSASDHSIYGTCPYKEVILSRELEDDEINELTSHLVDINKEKEGRLRRLKERAKDNDKLRTFVHFGLTAFGENFLGLPNYVEYRLQKADEKQKTVLSYLSLIHVFTNSLLPANALSDFLKIKRVNLEAELSDPYLRELLSPAGDEMDSRRISFHEVAQEILKQLGSSELGQNDRDTYNWLFIKQKSVEMAINVLSKYASTKSIDRLTRRLFVTSEYESEKFSSLIRTMTNEKHKRIACDTLTELLDVFTTHTSFRAHLLAHLAKYYMIEFEDFDKARPRIEEAVKNQKDDSLLRHIHGDIIRLHVQALKLKEEIDMPAIVKHAIKSSDCFAFVRRKRPNVSHGYISDAIVRITVMQAAMKDMGGGTQTSFIDYLIQMIDDMKKTSNYRLFVNERYLLSLIPDVHDFLDEGVIDHDHKEKWKGSFRKCIGKLENLRRLCDKVQEERNFFERADSKLLHDVALRILILNNSLMIQTKPLNSPERMLEIERLVKEVYDPDSSKTTSDQQMKYWIRYSRLGTNVPNLDQVRKEVKKWVDSAKQKGGISPDAEFYNYVINVMIALKDPKDAQKREKAEKLLKRQQGKKHKRKEDVLPLEWLHPKVGHHITSIDSLLHHDDLVKETNTKDGRKKQGQQPRRDVIEGFLFEKGIIKWEGTVKEIQRDWQGTIVFKGHFDVRFVPQNVQPSMPSTGDTVRFCLSFDRLGLTAWAVVRAPQNNAPKSALQAVSSEEESSNESDDESDDGDEVILDTSLFNQSGSNDFTDTFWEDYDGQRMQGVVVSTTPEKGFGKLKHPDVSGQLFFHAAQLVKPVKSLKGEIWKYMVLEFKVEQLSERTRAADIHVLTEEDKIQPTVANFRDSSVKQAAKDGSKKHYSPSTSRREKDLSTNQKKTTDMKRWEEGVVERLSTGQDYGFIAPENKSYGNKVFFHRRSLVNKGQPPRVGDRVQFYVSTSKKGYEANEIRVQNKSVAMQKWEQLTGIQDGFVDSVSDDGGYITSASRPQLGYLPFHNNDVLNGIAQITEGIEVHFEVKKRGGKCVAVKINVIGPLKEIQGKSRKKR